MTRFDNAVRLKRQAAPSSPASGLDAIYSDTAGRVSAVDTNGVRAFLTKNQFPDSWQGLGHSYFATSAGTFYQSGRADALFRSAMDIEFPNWRNRAVNGSMLLAEGRSQGGWARIMQEVVRPQRTAPYVSDGGASVMCWGINDIGKVGGSTQAQIRVMFENALRAVISRCRSAVIYDDGFSVGTRTTYGAGFTNLANTSEFSTGTTLRQATSTTSATITLTLPSDYSGEDVAIQFVANAGQGGTVTFSGTAGVTGSFVVSGIVPSGAGTHVPVVKRITTLTAANAGQTIIMTATAVSTALQFDAWWLESNYPPPVIVCNCARVLTAGYAIYANTIGDSDVAALNTSIANVVGEFDAMVQLADIDATINKDTTALSTDGLHPNELGAGKLVDALLNAIYLLLPTDTRYPSLNLNQSSPRAGVIRKPRLSGLYYSAEGSDTVVAQDPPAGAMWAAPYPITEGRERYNRLATRLAAGGSAAGTIRWGIYDDVDWTGYPQTLVAEATSAGAMSLGTAAGGVTNPASGTGSIFWELDPGLYWLVFKLATAGTGQALECITGPDRWGIMPSLDPTNVASLASPMAWNLGGQGSGALPTTFPDRVTAGAFADYLFPKMCLQLV